MITPKKGLKDIQLIIDSKSLEFRIIEYNGSSKKSKFIHICGNEFETRIDHLLNRGRCPKCSGIWRDKDMFQSDSDRVHKNEYEILEFKNGNEYVNIKHIKCGYIFNQKGYSHLQGSGCPKCSGRLKLSKDEILKRSKDKWGDEYDIISESFSYNSKSTIKHNICGNKFDQKISHHLLKGGCCYCAGNKKHDIKSVQLKSNKIHNSEYIILSEPTNFMSSVKILHLLCGREFEQVLGTHLCGCGCPICKCSKGEKFIERLLMDRNSNFVKQKSFDDCKFKRKLKFDFYLVDRNICIEYDGIQHFKPVRWFGGYKSFKTQKIKDEIKRKYCIDNNIKLIRFRYDDSLELIENYINSI